MMSKGQSKSKPGAAKKSVSRARPGTAEARAAKAKSPASNGGKARKTSKTAPSATKAAAAKAKPKPKPKAAARSVPPPPRRPSERPQSVAPPASIVPRTPLPPRIQMPSDPPPAARAAEEALVVKWARRGARLLRMLSAHGARDHEFRVDLKEGRFVWISPDGRVSAEARAEALCSYAQATSALTMAWADPLLKTTGVPRIDVMPSEQDALDEEQAWRVAMRAAEASGAEYLYRVAAPNAWYFLGLRDLSFQPARASFTPGTPVGLVLRGIDETRQAILSGAEPADVVRDRLSRTGGAFLHEADYAYRGTDWVSRLSRAGKRMLQLSEQVPRAGFDAVAQGAAAGEWLGPELATQLESALTMLEEEWLLFA
ncbi:DUF6882 domain-containing protein [Polyangium aurulentum]|uniref:DUF6882 domain-containing protein n=1 Tax=Polyangium aurulentum TaxID=2567896 RepID=UPI00146E2E17|nr:DUF6882 domain-containing protein [Polyangium aurulentum]UQA60916.1 hypothetical protein E8A73_010710 [Polyangium aurulentum]